MTPDYLTHIKPLEDAGMSNPQILSHLQSRTAGPIPCPMAKIVLEEHGLIIEDPITLQRSGTLADHYNGMSPGPLKGLLGWFISHVFGRGDQISSDTSPRAVQLASVLASLPPAFDEAGAALLALGGGQPFKDVTGPELVAEKQAYEDSLVAQGRRAESANQLSRLKNGMVTAYEAARAMHQSRDFTLDEDHAAAVRQAFIDAFTP